jgi:hypothetical protein
MIIAKKGMEVIGVAYFKCISWHIPGWYEETYENLGQNGHCPNQSLNSRTPEYKSELYIAPNTCMLLL